MNWLKRAGFRHGDDPRVANYSVRTSLIIVLALSLGTWVLIWAVVYVVVGQ